MSGSLRVAGVILYRGGRVLLQHRDDRPDIRWPGAWAIFGGHVEPGETPEEAARREIEEEVGLRLPGPLALVYHGDDGDRERFMFAAPLACEPEELTLGEGQGLGLFSEGELDALPVVPIHRRILGLFFRGGASGS